MKFQLLLFTFFLGLSLHAQVAGDLDNTYGNNGIAEYTVTVNGLLHGITIYDTYQLSNGKLLAVGWAQSGCSSTNNYQGVILRLNHDGSLDSSFQNGGYGFFGNSGFSQIIPNGNNEFLVVGNEKIRKIDLNGNLDTNYGVGGTVSTLMDFNSIALNPDGSMILGGRIMNSAGKWELTVSKRFVDGSLDTSFATNGYFKIPYVNLGATSLFDIKIDSLNRILINGRKQRTQNQGNIFVARLTATGQLDSNFANNGIYIDITHHDARARQTFIENDGKILILGDGQEVSFGSHGMILSRLHPNGVLDTSYGNNGRVHHPIYSDSTPDRIYPFENGYAISGDAFNTIFVARVNMDGSLNTTFNSTGFVLLNTFVYSGYASNSTIEGNRMIISANDSFADCAQSKYKAQFIRLFLNDNGLSITAYPADDLKICDDDNDGFAVFNLNQNDAPILNGQTGATVSYHTSQSDADQGINEIGNPQAYTNITNPQLIFARAQKIGTADFDTTTFNLIVNPSPILPSSIPNMVQCGNSIFNLTLRNAEILGNLSPSDFTIGYFTSNNDAVNNVYEIIDPTTFQASSSTQTIYARLTNLLTNCFAITNFEIIHGDSQIPVTPNDLFENDGTPDGFAIFDLTQNTPIVLNGDDPLLFEINYFKALSDAQQDLNSIISPEAFMNTTNPQTIFVRKTHLESECFAVSQFIIETDGIIGIADIQMEDLKLYPNPTNDLLNITSESFSSKVGLSIYSMDGKMISDFKIIPKNKKVTIDVSELSLGVYLIRLDMEGKITNKQFIKQ